MDMSRPTCTLKKCRVNNSLHLYGVKRFQSMRSGFQFVTRYSKKKMITDVTTQGVKMSE